MARQKIHDQRAGGRGSAGGGPSWISYSDMMAALLLVFVLILMVSLYRYFVMLETRTKELEAQTAALASVQQELEEQQVAVQQQQADLSALQEALDTQSALLEQKEAELAAAQAELDAQKALLEQQATDLKTAQDDLAAAQTELDAQKALLEQQAAELAAQQPLLEQQQKDLAAAQAELDAQKALLEQQAADLKTAQDSLAAAQAELTSAQAELTAAQAELESQKALLAQKEAELAALQTQLESQQALLAQKETELAALQASLDAQSALISQQQAALDAANAALAERELQLETLQTSLESKTEEISSMVGVRTEIITALSRALNNATLAATVDPETGEIMLSSSVLFDTGKYEIKDDGKALLDSFIPVYLGVLLREEYKPYLSAIIVEGHTDSTGSYTANLILSSNRALEVCQYVLNDQHLTSRQKVRLRELLTATGRGPANLILDENGIEDKAASRRVEFKFSLKDSEMINEIRTLLQNNLQ